MTIEIKSSVDKLHFRLTSNKQADFCLKNEQILNRKKVTKERVREMKCREKTDKHRGYLSDDA